MRIKYFLSTIQKIYCKIKRVCILFLSVYRRESLHRLRAFTLVELLVSMSVFSVVIVVAVGSVFVAQSLNTRVQAAQMSLDSLNLSLNLMTRNIRYGQVFYCGNNITMPLSQVILRQDCPLVVSDISERPNNTIAFRPVGAVSLNDRVGYYVNNKKLYEWRYTNGFTSAKQITSDDVEIITLHFFVSGAYTTPRAVTDGNRENTGGLTDYAQPMITIVAISRVYNVNNTSSQDRSYTDVPMQVTITPRDLDI